MKSKFSLAISLSTLLILVSTGIVYAALFSFNTEDQKRYQTLLQKTDRSHLEKKSPYRMHQEHNHVDKHFFWMKGGSRLQMELKSLSSELFFQQKHDHSEMVEKLKDVACIIQDECYYVLPDGKEVIINKAGKWVLRNGLPCVEDKTAAIPAKKVQEPQNGVKEGSPGSGNPEGMTQSWVKEDLAGIADETTTLIPMQIFHYLEAEEATYEYHAKRFFAHQVKLTRYIAKGHDLKKSLKGLESMASGMAQSIQFSMEDGGPLLMAKGFNLRS